MPERTRALSPCRRRCRGLPRNEYMSVSARALQPSFRQVRYSFALRIGNEVGVKNNGT